MLGETHQMKINDLDKKAIDYFMNFDNAILEKEVLLSWSKDHGVSGTHENAKTFVNNSKTMLSRVKINQEINSQELKIVLSEALFKYAKKLENELQNISFSEIEKIRKVRDEKLYAEKRAIEALIK